MKRHFPFPVLLGVMLTMLSIVPTAHAYLTPGQAFGIPTGTTSSPSPSVIPPIPTLLPAPSPATAVEVVQQPPSSSTSSGGGGRRGVAGTPTHVIPEVREQPPSHGVAVSPSPVVAPATPTIAAAQGPTPLPWEPPSLPERRDAPLPPSGPSGVLVLAIGGALAYTMRTRVLRHDHSPLPPS